MCVPLRISAYLWAWSRELFTTFLVFFFFLQGYTLVGDNFLLIVTQRLGSRTAPDRDRRGSALICWSWADGICRFRGNSLQQESYGSELALNADMGVSPDMHFHAFVFLVAQFGQWPHRGHIHTVMFCFFTSPWQLCVSRLKSTFFLFGITVPEFAGMVHPGACCVLLPVGSNFRQPWLWPSLPVSWSFKRK